MATIRSFTELEVWKSARMLNREIYRCTQDGVFAKDFALRSQIRRASISVMSNVAEGFERQGRKEFINFLSIARGSTGEVESQLYSALDVGYLTEREFEHLRDLVLQTRRLMVGLMKYLSQSKIKGAKYKPSSPATKESEPETRDHPHA